MRYANFGWTGRPFVRNDVATFPGSSCASRRSFSSSLLAVAERRSGGCEPLDLDATRAALATIDTALKDKNLTEADLQRLRAQNDPLGVRAPGGDRSI